METIDILKEILSPNKPVSFREFCSGRDYCNNPNIYEYWYNEYDKLPPLVNEMVIDGSLGGGKTVFSSYYLAYRVYLLFFEGTPQSKLGLPDNSDIYCLYFSVSLSIAKKSGFNLLYSIFKECTWFKNNAPINTELKSSIEFIDKHFYIDFASDFGHQISLNVWGFILDEANFRQGVGNGTEEQYSEVTELYQQLLDRQASRFARPDGSVNAVAILVSSASYQSAFSSKRAEVVDVSQFGAHITVCKYLVTPELFSKETFRVFIGAGTVEAQVILDEEHENKLLQLAGIYGTGEESKFIREVPVNLKGSFDSNVVLALQNHCGIPTTISSAFMSNLTFLRKSYIDILPIFSSFNLQASTADDTQLFEYLIDSNIEYPDRPHSMFLDLSVQHDTGCLCCYRYDGEVNNKSMHTRVFSLRILPATFPAQTSITKVQQLVIELATRFNLVTFGSDQYQCFTGDTIIPTLICNKKIKDITTNDILFTHSGKLCKVLNTFKYENANVIEVTLDNGYKFQCTPSHRFPVIVKGNAMLVPAIALTGKMLVPNNLTAFYDPIKVISVTPVQEKKTVYNIEVSSEDHTYYTYLCLTSNSTQLRQDVNNELGLKDIRISIDSSDVPHIHWQKALVDGRIHQSPDPYLEKEVKECIHDWKRRRVIKATKSSDDVFQANVGAFFLSDTEGKTYGSIEGLYGERTNLVGGKSITSVLKMCGYNNY